MWPMYPLASHSGAEQHSPLCFSMQNRIDEYSVGVHLISFNWHGQKLEGRCTSEGFDSIYFNECAEDKSYTRVYIDGCLWRIFLKHYLTRKHVMKTRISKKKKLRALPISLSSFQHNTCNVTFWLPSAETIMHPNIAQLYAMKSSDTVVNHWKYS